MKRILAALLLVGIAACNNGKDEKNGETTNPDAPKTISYSIITTYPHDTSSFTEGLLIYNGDLYESTGEKGKSRLMKTDLKTGKVLKSIDLDSNYFGEGIAVLNDTIYQLTYQEKVGFMYSIKDFKKLAEFKFSTKTEEGWGMTTDGKQIIATDGTSNLYYYEPSTFRLLRTQEVTDAGSLSFNLNELEYIDGYIYANQWQYPYIFKIDPSNGQIVGKIDLSETANRIKVNYHCAEFLNGIAYDAATKKMYVTGKRWPDLYEIQLSK